MTAEQFAYWLQGYSEIAGTAPSPEQWQVIQDHLKLVFDKRTPLRDLTAIPAQFPYKLDTGTPLTQPQWSTTC